MESIDFERARISWTTRGGVNGSWRVIATACRQDLADCIYLAPAVMAGNIFGTNRLPIDPPFLFQLIATRDRHAIIRDGEASRHKDNEADHEATFSQFDIDAPQLAARVIEVGGLLSGDMTQLWPMSVRLTAHGKRGTFWNLEFPIGHINTQTKPVPAFQIETGPILIPRDLAEIPGASIIGGCYLAYAFLNKATQVDLLAFGPSGNNVRRSFVHFARLDSVETHILGQR